MMIAALPSPVLTYFTAANARDIEGMLAPFAEEASVVDEGVERQGRAAIRAWIEETTSKYAPTLEPTGLGGTATQPSVTTRVAGRFAGSPIDLTFGFTLDSHRIVRLEIR